VRFCAVKAICGQAVHWNYPILLITVVGRVRRRLLWKVSPCFSRMGMSVNWSVFGEGCFLIPRW
jgi:hypothetical protein